MSPASEENPVGGMLEADDVAAALGSDRFKHVLDQAPIGIAVAELGDEEIIVYANSEMERLTGLPADVVVGRTWAILGGMTDAEGAGLLLSRAIVEDTDHIGAFSMIRDGESLRLDAWSNQIEDDDGEPVYRLVALAARATYPDAALETLEHNLATKDLQLRELQHRVKNNLQMITSLIRFEARGLPDNAVGERFDRLAGRVGALALLYRSLGETDGAQTVDLGVYLSEIATNVMRAHATEGIRLDLKVDTWPVSINVAMPAGLVVNELLTNSLKHAFEGREGGTIRMHSLVDDSGCRVVVADDGVGLPQGATWPTPGKMSALFARSLVQNANASLDIVSRPNSGVTVEIRFARADAEPEGSPQPENQSPARTGM
jgi:PAS domain S-box-containing protein